MSWSAADLLVRYGLNAVVLVILARILSPADFGLVAMLGLFVAVATLLTDSGFSQALIQRQETTLVDESTIFFFTLAMGGVVALVLCALAPWIAAFYGQPLLAKITYWMALNVFLNAFGTIHTAVLSKELDFRTIAKVGAVSTTVSAGMAICMAWYGWGVWSLVGQALVFTITQVAMLWLLHPWRPQWIFDFAALRSYFKFGGFLLWVGIVSTLHTNLYALLVGKLHSVQEVGFYSQAQRLQQIPVNVLTHLVGRVAFPVFAAAVDDREKLVSILRKGLVSVMFVNIPLMLGVMIFSTPLILILLGEKWLPCAPVLQVLAVSGLLWPFAVLNVNVLNAQGHSALTVRIQFVRLTTFITLLLITAPYGILAIAYGQAAAQLLTFFINTYYTKKLLGYGGVSQLRDVLPYFAASLVVLLTTFGLLQLAELSPRFELLVAVMAAGWGYWAVCKLAKLEAVRNLF